MISKTAQARTISFNSWLRAAEGGDLKTLFYGLAQGLAVNRVDDLGQNALMKAAYAGRDAAVELLLDEGAAIDAVDANGNTTLMRAAIQGRAKTVGILVKRGDDLWRVQECACFCDQRASWRWVGNHANAAGCWSKSQYPHKKRHDTPHDDVCKLHHKSNDG
jgi:ankyrin repeat protein